MIHLLKRALQQGKQRNSIILFNLKGYYKMTAMTSVVFLQIQTVYFEWRYTDIYTVYIYTH